VDLKRFRWWSPITGTINENRHLLRTSGGIAVLIITAGVLLWTLFAALRPLPGRDVSIATGPPGSAYVQVAERYREILARNGVRLHLVPTDGAVANLERLRDPTKGVDAGFVQADTTSQRESPNTVKRRERGSDEQLHAKEAEVFRNRWVIEKQSFFGARSVAAQIVRDETIGPREAVRQHPELAGTYLNLRAAEIASRALRDPQDRHRFVAQVRGALADGIERGEPLQPVRLRTAVRTATERAPLTRD
jgi:hypothetical protein